MARSRKSTDRSLFTTEALENRRLLTASTRNAYLIGNSLTDGVDYTGLEQLLELDGSKLNLGRQTGPGFQQSANYDLNSGYVTGGVKAGSTSGNPWGDYKTAFAANTWDDVTLQPHERHLTSDVYNGENQAEVPISLKFMEALEKGSPNAQVFIYSRPSRRTDVDDDLSRPATPSTTPPSGTAPTKTAPRRTRRSTAAPSSSSSCRC